MLGGELGVSLDASRLWARVWGVCTCAAVGLGLGGLNMCSCGKALLVVPSDTYGPSISEARDPSLAFPEQLPLVGEM